MVGQRVRLAGLICLVGGIAWVITVALQTQIPLGSPSYMVAETILVAAQVMLLIGALGLAWSGATGTGWLTRGGLAIALLGRMAFVLAELHIFVSGTATSPLLPPAALLTGLGMLIVGIAVLRAKRWSGWARITPLLCGIYPFVAMFPFIAISRAPSPLAVAGWGLFWALLGLALRVSTAIAEPLRPGRLR